MQIANDVHQGSFGELRVLEVLSSDALASIYVLPTHDDR